MLDATRLAAFDGIPPATTATGRTRRTTTRRTTTAAARMKTSRRLFQLETKMPGTSNNQSLEPLCELLGTVDGLFFPHRQFGGRVSALTAITQQRRQYHRVGIVWNLADGSARSWKSAQRLRDSMQAQGWIDIHRDSALTVKLTILGDSLARQALGLPTSNNWLPMRLTEMLSEFEPDRPGGWLSENTLVGDTGDRAALADCLLPLLSLGIVESLSSTVGEIFYRPTGQCLPQCREDGSGIAIDGPNDNLLESYQSAFEAALSSRERIEPIDSEVIVPLPASRV